jgi:sterol 24-C-methyltransferase
VRIFPHYQDLRFFFLLFPQADIDNCVKAYQFFQEKSDFTVRDQDAETEHVRSYYTVVNEVLAVADIEKMYIPPQIDAKKGLYENQIIWEKIVADSLALKSPKESRLLDIGCGRGRIAHHIATYTGASVSGFNIDANQIENAISYAAKTGMDSRLDFRVGDHHKTFDFADNSFDGAYSFQALWPFFAVHELDSVASEIFRVLKPGAKFSCGEYLLTPEFDKTDQEHMRLHKLFLPTLAATQSNYPKDISGALVRAGFTLKLSRPSIAPAWPLTDQKTDLFLLFRSIVIKISSVGLLPPWVETLVDQLLLGGQAWAAAEKAKIADLNWQMIVEKPLN